MPLLQKDEGKRLRNGDLRYLVFLPSVEMTEIPLQSSSQLMKKGQEDAKNNLCHEGPAKPWPSDE
jgi:hypothetical protein